MKRNSVWYLWELVFTSALFAVLGRPAAVDAQLSAPSHHDERLKEASYGYHFHPSQVLHYRCIDTSVQRWPEDRRVHLDTMIESFEARVVVESYDSILRQWTCKMVFTNWYNSQVWPRKFGKTTVTRAPVIPACRIILDSLGHLFTSILLDDVSEKPQVPVTQIAGFNRVAYDVHRVIPELPARDIAESIRFQIMKKVPPGIVVLHGDSSISFPTLVTAMDSTNTKYEYASSKVSKSGLDELCVTKERRGDSDQPGRVWQYRTFLSIHPGSRILATMTKEYEYFGTPTDGFIADSYVNLFSED